MKALIVDDEPLARRVLEKYIGQTPDIELHGSCENAAEAEVILQKQQIDIMFLDIRMPGMSGMDFARSLTDGPLIVFVTAFPQYAAEGFELEAVDYLVKPFSYERYEQAVRRAQYLLAAEQQQKLPIEQSLLIKSDKKLYRIPVNTILYLEGYGDYVKVHSTRTKMLLTKDTLKNLQKNLPSAAFIKIHRSFIVAIQAIQYIEGNQLCVNDVMLPISESYKKAVMKKIE